MYPNKHQMIQQQLMDRGITDAAVLDAMRRVPREAFVEKRLAQQAYRDSPLPIGREQTISQPYIVALMAQSLQLQPHERLLEIGTGSGYAAAVFSHLAAQVFSIERHADLADSAKDRLDRLGFQNIHIRNGDGNQGWPEAAPFDAIAIAAAAGKLPETLLQQLAQGGRMVVPVGKPPKDQDLVLVRRVNTTEFKQTTLGKVRFVPLTDSDSN